MARNIRQAFTVVELLVVIAIIGVLMGLLLPAVQMARVAAWKAKCASNMRNWGVAEQAYVSAKAGSLSSARAFPLNLNIPRPANIDTSMNPSNPNAQSWVHPLLPHIEREDLWSVIQNATAGQNLADLGLQNQYIPIAFCPADNSDYNDKNRMSYAANGGRENGAPPGSGSIPLDWPSNGVLDDRLQGTMDGSQFRVFQSPMSDVSAGDGQANTLLFLENADVMGWTIDTLGVGGANADWSASVVWYLTQPTPAVRRKTGDPYTRQHARPTSFHTQGFNAVFCDGSVKFISETIDYGVYAQLMTSNSRRLQEPSSTTTTNWGATGYPTILNADSY